MRGLSPLNAAPARSLAVERPAKDRGAIHIFLYSGPNFIPTTIRNIISPFQHQLPIDALVAR